MGPGFLRASLEGRLTDAEQMLGAALPPDWPGDRERTVRWRLDDLARNEVRVRMAAAGVCHSDLHVVDGEWERPAGVVLGHEGAAWVESLGEGVTSLEVGDLVVLAWTAPCTTCTACER